MTDQKTLLEYAIKGIDAEIAEIEKSIRNGRKLIVADENRLYDIQPIINLKKAEIEKLVKLQNDYKWQLAMVDEK